MENWEKLLEEGDAALQEGHVRAAVQQYEVVDRSLTADEPTTGQLFLSAVVAHRIGVAEYLVGNVDTADEMFARVATVTEEAENYASKPIVREYAAHLRQQSSLYRDRLADAITPGLPETFGVLRTPDFTMSVICQHGCPTIFDPCPYNSNHC